MNDLVFVENGRLVTESLIVAEVFGKEHKNVLRDIEELGCSAEFSRLNFEQSTYVNERGREYPRIIMTEQGLVLLIMGYTGDKAMEYKERYIAEFDRMRAELNNGLRLVLPSNYKEALTALLAQVDENEKLQSENLMLEQRVAEFEPKASYVDSILKSKSTVTITQIAKDYGLTGQKLNSILHDEEVQYKLNNQWLLYRKHQDQGLTKSQTIDVFHNDGSRSVKMNTQWTQKGRLFIHGILQRRGITPYMDRKANAANDSDAVKG